MRYITFFLIMSLFVSFSSRSTLAEGLVYQLPAGTMPSYESYARGTGIAKINESYPRPSQGASTGCSGDYPKRIGLKCFRQNPCPKRKKSNYSFDGISTCDRKAKIATDGSPLTYPAKSRGVSFSCPSGYGDMAAGVCYAGCKSGFHKSGLFCYNDRNGQCQSNREESGGLCYIDCKTGFHGEGVTCYANNKTLCDNGKVLRDGLCYETCEDGYNRVANTCTNIAALAQYTKAAAAGFTLTASNPGITGTKCASTNSDNEIGYCDKVSVDLRACGSMFDKDSCFGPGNLTIQVAGSTGLTTYLSAQSGEASATIEANQTLTIGFFGAKPIEVGIECQFTKGGATSFSHTFGASMETPPIPSLEASDALNKIKSQSQSLSASGSSSTTAPKVDSALMKTLESVSVPCGIIMPDPKLFSGVPSISLYEVGTTLTLSAENWKIEKNSASVDLIVSAGVVATIGGDTVEVTGLGQTFNAKVPGFGFKKDVANLISQSMMMDY
jgi:hypothetical protein